MKQTLLYLFINIILILTCFGYFGTETGVVYTYIFFIISLFLAILKIIKWGECNPNKYKIVSVALGVMSSLMAAATLLLAEFIL